MKSFIIALFAASGLAVAGLSMAAPAMAVTPTPIVTSLTPNHGSFAGGNTVVISGSNLTDPANGVDPKPTSVHFGSTPATILSCAPAPAATCQVTVPAGAGIPDVTVTDGADGTSVTSVADHYTYQGATRITSDWSGKAVDDRANSAANGNAIQQWDTNSLGGQNWALIGHTIQIHGKCMDVRGQSTRDGAKIQLWTCSGNPNQKWSFRSNGEIVDGFGKCLDVTGYSTLNGTQLQQWTCNDTINQKWATAPIA
jgi:hypothetical protein